MEVNEKDTSEILPRLKDIASQQVGAFDFISNLRKYIMREEPSLINLSVSAEPEQVAILYLLETFLNDIWLNLSTDASFEFPRDDVDIKAVSENLRDTVLLAAGRKTDFGMAMKHLCQAIHHYHICLNRLELQLLNEGPRRREVRR